MKRSNGDPYGQGNLVGAGQPPQTEAKAPKRKKHRIRRLAGFVVGAGTLLGVGLYSLLGRAPGTGNDQGPKPLEKTGLEPSVTATIEPSGQGQGLDQQQQQTGSLVAQAPQHQGDATSRTFESNRAKGYVAITDDGTKVLVNVKDNIGNPTMSPRSAVINGETIKKDDKGTISASIDCDDLPQGLSDFNVTINEGNAAGTPTDHQEVVSVKVSRSSNGCDFGL